MRSIKPWASALGVPEATYKSWLSFVPQGTSFTFWCLINKKISEEKYLAWAREHFEIASLSSDFFRSPPNIKFWSQIHTVSNWSVEMIPIGHWDGTVFIASVEPHPEMNWSFPVQFVLAKASDLKAYWKKLSPPESVPDEKTFIKIPPPPNKQEPAYAHKQNPTTSFAPDAPGAPPPLPPHSVVVATPPPPVVAPPPIAPPPPPVEESPSVEESPRLPAEESPIRLNLNLVKPQDAPEQISFSAPEGFASAAPEGLSASAPEGFSVPEGLAAPEGFSVPEGLAAPEGFSTSAPEGLSASAPEGFSAPEGLAAPEGFSTPKNNPSPLQFSMPEGVSAPEGSSHSQDSVLSLDVSMDTLTPAAPAPPLKPVPEPQSPPAPEPPKIPPEVMNVLHSVRNVFMGGMILNVANNQFKPYVWDELFKSTNEKAEKNWNLNAPSAFRVAYRTKLPYLGHVVDTPTNKDFFSSWGLSTFPKVILIQPVLAEDQVCAFILALSDGSKKNSEMLTSSEKLASDLALSPPPTPKAA